MIFIPYTEDRSEPIEFISEEWESGSRGRAAAQRELEKVQRMFESELTAKQPTEVLVNPPVIAETAQF